MKLIKWGLVLFVLIQFVPYGRDHINPAVAKEAPWNSPSTKDLARRACYDCHSNETTWPWYSHIAPVSWLVMRDVAGGRQHLNFSEWDKPQRHALRRGGADQERRDAALVLSADASTGKVDRCGKAGVDGWGGEVVGAEEVAGLRRQSCEFCGRCLQS